MNPNNLFQRLTVIALSIVMVLAMTLGTVSAEVKDNQNNPNGDIIAFESLRARLAASSADSESVSVQITEDMTVAGIKSAIEAALDSIFAGGSVTVTGWKFDANTTLELTIPEGKELVWEAWYEGTVGSDEYLINLLGAGSFKVTQKLKSNQTESNAINVSGSNQVTVSGQVIVYGGGTAINASGENSMVTINGGRVEVSGNYYGTAINASGENFEVTVNGGTVSVDAGDAINTSGQNCNVTVNNGQVSASYGTVINAGGASSTVTVSGGMVEANTGFAINAGGASSTVTVSGGMVKANTGVAINADGASSTVTVSGGTVTSAGTVYPYDNAVINMLNPSNTNRNVVITGTGRVVAAGDRGYAICTYGSVEVSGGQVEATTGRAIFNLGASSTVTVSGGTVTGAGTTFDAPAIYMSNTDNTDKNVMVTGTGQVEATGDGGYAIRTYGSVEVSGGTVRAIAGTAIHTDGAGSWFTVSGGMVSGADGVIMANYTNTNKNVMVTGTGRVEATGDGGFAISTHGSVEIGGGQVEATTGRAIFNLGASSTVTVSGGTVTGAGTTFDAPTIYMSNTDNTNSNVIVKGTGQVEATGDGGSAISTHGSVIISGGQVEATTGMAIQSGGSVAVMGGTVSSTTGVAINVLDPNSSVMVLGGVVFAHGNDITGLNNVIQFENGSGSLDVDDPGLVLAWNSDEDKRTYYMRSNEHISKLPDNASVYWAVKDNSPGIYYKNGANEGFISLNVTVEIDPEEGGCLVTYKGAQKRHNADSKTYDIRFIATIDTLEANAVGFVFSKSETKPTKEKVPPSQVKSTTTVYHSVTAAGSAVTAESLGGKYIIACTVTGIPENDIDTPLYVRAFSTVGTETKYTSAVTVTVNSL